MSKSKNTPFDGWTLRGAAAATIVGGPRCSSPIRSVAGAAVVRLRIRRDAGIDDIRARALDELRRFGVLMLDGHFDYGNGYHGRTYLNPHQLFRYPSTIWRLAQDLLDVVPSDVTSATEVVAGPVTGGALLAHTIAGLLDSRRSLTHPPCSFAPFGMDGRTPPLRSFYRRLVKGRRVLLADDVLNTGQTLQRCAEVVREAGGTVLAAVVHLRPARVDRGHRRARDPLTEYRGAGELSGRRLPALPGRHAGDGVLAGHGAVGCDRLAAHRRLPTAARTDARRTTLGSLRAARSLYRDFNAATRSPIP